MINIISTDSVYSGESSALGIRAYQLYKLFDSYTETKLWVPDINYKNIGDPNITFYPFKGGFFDYKDDQIYILPLNAFHMSGWFKNIIIDGFSPILVEELFLNLDEVEKKYRRDSILNMLINCRSILVSNYQQELYYTGLLNAFNINKPLINLPLYLPISTERKFIQADNDTLLFYGGVYPWTDLHKIFTLLHIIPKKYKILFKGVKHPRYKRDKGLDILNDELKNWPKIKDRVTIDTTWDNKVIEASAGIFLGKAPEMLVACRTRALDMMSQGLPVILDEQEPVYSLGSNFNSVISTSQLLAMNLKIEPITGYMLETFHFEKIRPLVKSILI